MTHPLRCAPPAATQQATRSYDAVAELDNLTVAQPPHCQMPLRLGGRRFRSQEQLAPAACVAAWAQCLAEVLGRTGLDCLENLDTCELPLAAACRDARAMLPAVPIPAGSGREAAPLGTWRELALEPRKKVQRLFGSWLDKKQLRQVLDPPLA